MGRGGASLASDTGRFTQASPRSRSHEFAGGARGDARSGGVGGPAGDAEAGPTIPAGVSVGTPAGHPWFWTPGDRAPDGFGSSSVRSAVTFDDSSGDSASEGSGSENDGDAVGGGVGHNRFWAASPERDSASLDGSGDGSGGGSSGGGSVAGD